MRSIRAMSLFVFVALAALLPVAAVAQEPADVAEGLRDDGVYVDQGLSITEQEVGQSVAVVRAEGEQLSIAVLFGEPIGGATTFADAVFDRMGAGVVLVLAEDTVGYSGVLEVYTDAEFREALEIAGASAETDSEFLEVFVAELTGRLVAGSGSGSSGATATTAASGNGSGGGFGFLFWLLVIGGAVVLFMWWRRRRATAKPAKLPPQMIEAKEKVQEQINAVANDIIDMEDEVRLADNDQADEFYQGAGATYTDVVETYPDASTPQSLIALSNKLDEAIWQLDSAEAVLDDRPPPPRPEPQRIQVPEPAQEPASGSGRPSSLPGGSTLPPRPDYDRRPSRRSSYGGGSSLMNILIGMAGAMVAGGGRRRGMRQVPSQRVQNPRFPPVPTRSSPIPTPANPRGGSVDSRSRNRASRGSGRRSRGGVRRTKRRRR